ncbi:hypothetical protein E2C01_084975 [Portunus trituberculatus]|uniref:Uncharacterized protein n=1 Tax=Portunus trituberculatus TaxID=210409 RepID=A0A5B7J5J0_PORTR|nr:hypothetical protein [Portunus trituberculatus]
MSWKELTSISRYENRKKYVQEKDDDDDDDEEEARFRGFDEKSIALHRRVLTFGEKIIQLDKKKYEK